MDNKAIISVSPLRPYIHIGILEGDKVFTSKMPNQGQANLIEDIIDYCLCHNCSIIQIVGEQADDTDSIFINQYRNNVKTVYSLKYSNSDVQII